MKRVDGLGLRKMDYVYTICIKTLLYSPKEYMKRTSKTHTRE